MIFIIILIVIVTSIIINSNKARGGGYAAHDPAIVPSSHSASPFIPDLFYNTLCKTILQSDFRLCRIVPYGGVVLCQSVLYETYGYSM